MVKEGFSVLLALLLFSIIITIGAVVTHSVVLKIFVLIVCVLISFSIYFFRDPERTIPTDNNLIISPADGKVILIEEIKETEFFKDSVQKVSIFMSAFDVHVNRIPVTGQVTYFNYKKGKYHPAYKEAAPYENEQTVIAIENDQLKVIIRQIAGIFARRIVCYIREGWKVKQGERFGMIKFGSRVDLLLPKMVQIDIKLNQKVKAGETIIGRY